MNDSHVRWVESPLRCLFLKLVNGGTPSTEVPAYWGGSTAWVTGADFTDGGIGDIRRYVSKLGISSSSTSVVDPGNLLVVTRTGVGKLAIADEPIAISQDITGVYPDTGKVDVKFLYFLLLRELEDLKKLNQGTSINGIVRSDFERHTVYFPNQLTEQKKIAHILQTIDQAIEKTKALIEKYQQIKVGLMNDLFTRGIGPDGKLRPSREEAPELYQETAIGWIPKEWDSLGLAEKAKPGTPHLQTGPFGSSLKNEHWVEEGNPVITIGSLGEGNFESLELLYIGDDDAARLSNFKMKIGDVVFSRVADVGRSVVIKENHVGWIMSSNMMRISLDQSHVIPDFLQLQLAYGHSVKKQIRCRVNSGGREVANSQILNSLLFVWAEVEEQEHIVDRADSATNLIRKEQEQLDKLRKKRAGLMHDLLTGEVQVVPMSREGANV